LIHSSALKKIYINVLFMGYALNLLESQLQYYDGFLVLDTSLLGLLKEKKVFSGVVMIVKVF